MSLEAYLKERIARDGPLSVAAFMEEALSHPLYGYYQHKNPFGTQGDFITAPEISQIFGELIGIWCACVWQSMGLPQEIILVEMGPGRGTLMQDCLRGTKHIPGFHEAFEVHFIETSPYLTHMQQQAFLDYKEVRFFWHTHLSMLPEKPMILIANELFDALPIHQYVKTPFNWHEKKIGIDEVGNALTFMVSPLETAMVDWLLQNYPNAPEGAIIEYAPLAHHMMADIAARLQRHKGAALMIDYGYTTPLFMDSLQAVQSHNYHPVLQEPGLADITAHVDFQAIAHTAKERHAEVYGPINQAVFLREMGIEARAKMLLHYADEHQQKAIVSGVERLMSSNQMGELFKVMAVTSRGLAKPEGFV